MAIVISEIKSIDVWYWITHNTSLRFTIEIKFDLISCKFLWLFSFGRDNLSRQIKPSTLTFDHLRSFAFRIHHHSSSAILDPSYALRVTLYEFRELFADCGFAATGGFIFNSVWFFCFSLFSLLYTIYLPMRQLAFWFIFARKYIHQPTLAWQLAQSVREASTDRTPDAVAESYY